MIAAHEYDQNSMESEEEFVGPHIQPIEGGLMAGDYIEIHGICTGSQIIIQLLTSENLSDNQEILPLHMVIFAGGPVRVRSRSKSKENQQEYYVRNCTQPSLTFEILIYAMEDEFQVKLNGEQVCALKHSVNLENVIAIYMDGKAEFTSIEFKEMYGEEESYAPTPEPGFMVVQEMRESFHRKKGAPMLVRTSTRRSKRSAKAIQEPLAAKSSWPTSNDLSRPELDIDPAPVIVAAPVEPVARTNVQTPTLREVPPTVEVSPKSAKRFSLKIGNRKSVDMEPSSNYHLPIVGEKPSRHTIGDEYQGVYQPLDDDRSPSYRPGSQTMYVGSVGNLNTSSPNLTDSLKKKRSSLIFGRSKKSKGSESDVSLSGGEKKRKGIKNLFKSRKSITLNSGGDVRQSISMPDVSHGDSYPNIRYTKGLETPQAPYFGIGADLVPPKGPVPKSMLKLPAPDIASFMVAQKAVPEFERFSLTHPDLAATPSFGIIPETVDHQRASVYSEPKDERKVKGTAPQLADALIANNKAGFDQLTTLTTSSDEPVYTVLTESAPVDVGKTKTLSGQKLKGPAPEIAAVLHAGDHGTYHKDTTLTNEQTLNADRLPTVYAEAAVMPPKTSKKRHSGKFDGTAPEIASELYDSQQARYTLFSDTTLTSTQPTQKPAQMVIDRPSIDRDFIYTQSQILEKPQAGRQVQSARPSSADRHRTDHWDSDESSVYSDEGYYLDIGQSDYYLERRRSLKKYRSRRSHEMLASRDQRSNSIRSSISSFKSDDRIPDVHRRSKQSSNGRTMSGYADEFYIQPSPANRPKVYAAPPVIQAPAIAKLKVDISKLKEDNFKARLPLPLTPGRSARLLGHFNEEGYADRQCCFVHLEFGQNNGIHELVLQTWSNGSLSVFGIANDQQHCYHTWENVESTSDEKSNGSSSGGKFVVDFHARGLYFAITMNNFITLKILTHLDPAKLETVRLEPCNNAELDYLTVSNDLLMPIDVTYPDQSHRLDLQRLTLDTKFNAFSKQLILQFHTQIHKMFDLVFDFVENVIYLKTVENGLTKFMRSQKDAIPLVPEQIRTVSVEKHSAGNRLKVFTNQTAVFEEQLPLPRPIGKLSHVRICGDLVLLNAKLD